MLASQESMLRSQPTETDYRAATVKQRPTSRRITPAEISVSGHTRRTLEDTNTPSLQPATLHVHYFIHCIQHFSGILKT